MSKSALFSLALCAVPAVAFADHDLSLNSTSGDCPSSLHLGAQGDSFASGIRYTLDIKNMVRPGTVKIEKGPLTPYGEIHGESYAHVIFTADLAQFRTCDSDTYFHDMFLNDSGVARLTLKNGKLRFVVKDPANVITGPSAFNNQAIWFYAEAM